jgi:hypothetical protein
MAEFPGPSQLAVAEEDRWKMLQRALNNHFQLLADELNAALAANNITKLKAAINELDQLLETMDDLSMID